MHTLVHTHTRRGKDGIIFHGDLTCCVDDRILEIGMSGVSEITRQTFRSPMLLYNSVFSVMENFFERDTESFVFVYSG